MTDTAPPLDEKSGYPSAQEAYPPPYPNPQEGGYPPPQGGYPPPQSYPPPQEGYPPPQQSGYPPPQGSYPPPQQQGYPPPGYSDQQAPPPQQQQSAATTVVVQQQPVEVKVAFRDRPVVLPDGNTTVLRYKIGLLSWIVVGIVCLVTLECGICCVGFIALLIDGLKDVEHVHPVTGQVVGVYKRI